MLLSAPVSYARFQAVKENKNNCSIEFAFFGGAERQAVISKLLARFEKKTRYHRKQVPVEEAYNTKVITLSRSGSLPEVIKTSHDYLKVMDKEQLIDRKAVATVISNVGGGAFLRWRTADYAAPKMAAPGPCSCQRMDWRDLVPSQKMCWQKLGWRAKTGSNWLDVAQKLNDPANKKIRYCAAYSRKRVDGTVFLPVCVIQSG